MRRTLMPASCPFASQSAHFFLDSKGKIGSSAGFGMGRIIAEEIRALIEHTDTPAEIQNMFRGETLASRECDATENMYNQSE